MKKNVLYIAAEKFAAIAAELGLETQDNAGFVQWKLGNGYHLYVAKTKTVGRVDFQFGPPEGLTGVRHLGPGEKFGRIGHQLDFDTELGEAKILETFRTMVLHGASLAKWERPKKAQPGTPVAASSPKPELSKEERKEAAQRRRELIMKTAKEMGVAVSPKVEAAAE